MVQKRTKNGRFAPKSNDVRKVRAIRVTDETWNTLGILADSRDITRADLLEDLIASGQLTKKLYTPGLDLHLLMEQVLQNVEVTRGGKDKGSVKRALELFIRLITE